jgi:ribonuclease G
MKTHGEKDMEEILLNIESKEIRCAYLKNGVLHDLILERKKARQLTGNIYKGKVINILHNIQSAFIDINEGENGFIHISDIIENTQKFEQMFDMDFDLDYDIKALNAKDKRKMSIEELMKLEQSVLVQVVKEPIGTKGARLTSNISIAGRYLVLLPNSPHRGVSKKIENYASRNKLRKLIRAFEMPQDMGLICRTASQEATTEQLIEEANELLGIWENVKENFNKADGPTCLYEESDIIKRSLMVAVDKKINRILIDDYTVYQYCKRLYAKYAEEHPLRIEYYRDKVPMYERFNVEREIDKTIRRKIWLPSGGYLYFDRTEAMYTIDINSGRSTNINKNVEETLVRINLEGAEEIARQLRLRNIGGLVICDFIDMRLHRNQRRVLDRLKTCMKDDSAKCTILRMSEFGLIEMTRQRQRESLVQTMLTECPYCNGAGAIKNHETILIEIERALKKVISCSRYYAVKLVIHPELARYMGSSEKEELVRIAESLNALLEIEVNDDIHINDYMFFSLINEKAIEV